MATEYSFQFKIDDKGFNTWLAGLRHRMNNLETPMKVIGDQMVKSVRENFLQSGRPEKWKELSAATIIGALRTKDFTKKGALTAKAVKKVNTRKILIGNGMKGGLMDSIHYEATSDSVSIGPDNRPYARIHQFGGMAGRGKKVAIPARPYLVVQDADVEMAKKIIMAHLLDR